LAFKNYDLPFGYVSRIYATVSQPKLQYCAYIHAERTPYFQQVMIISDLNKNYSLGTLLANLLKYERKE